MDMFEICWNHQRQVVVTFQLCQRYFFFFVGYFGYFAGGHPVISSSMESQHDFLDQLTVHFGEVENEKKSMAAISITSSYNVGRGVFFTQGSPTSRLKDFTLMPTRKQADSLPRGKPWVGCNSDSTYLVVEYDQHELWNYFFPFFWKTDLELAKLAKKPLLFDKNQWFIPNVSQIHR